MRIAVELLDIFLGNVRNVFSLAVQKVVYGWDGKIPRDRVRGFLAWFNNIWLPAGHVSNPTEWVDITKCGKPRIQFEFVIMLGYYADNYLDIGILVDYGTLVDGRMEVHYRQTERLMHPAEAPYRTMLFNVRIHKDRGAFIRIREVRNNGDIAVRVTARSPLSMKYIGTIETVDRDVVEVD